MESGAMVLFRAIVMLSCLVLIPMAAIFGSAFPNLIQGCLPDSWRSVVKSSSPATSAEAPTFGPPQSRVAASAAPAPQWPSTTGNPEKPANPSSLAAAPVWPDTKSFETSPTAVRRSVPSAALANDSELSGRANVPAAFSAPADMSEGRVASVSRAVPGRDERFARAGEIHGASPSTATTWPSRASNKPADGTDRFTTIEQRLRSYGATHYHLETWGQRGELYRFQCQMPASARGGTSPAFEAVDASALEAMQRVLQQVETLRSTARQ
jgi:hypothetical protein